MQRRFCCQTRKPKAGHSRSAGLSAGQEEVAPTGRKPWALGLQRFLQMPCQPCGAGTTATRAKSTRRRQRNNARFRRSAYKMVGEARRTTPPSPADTARGRTRGICRATGGPGRRNRHLPDTASATGATEAGCAAAAGATALGRPKTRSVSLTYQAADWTWTM
jgi:hypothetical protein